MTRTTADKARLHSLLSQMSDPAWRAWMERMLTGKQRKAQVAGTRKGVASR